MLAAAVAAAGCDCITHPAQSTQLQSHPPSTIALRACCRTAPALPPLLRAPGRGTPPVAPPPCRGRRRRGRHSSMLEGVQQQACAAPKPTKKHLQQRPHPTLAHLAQRAHLKQRPHRTLTHLALALPSLILLKHLALQRHLQVVGRTGGRKWAAGCDATWGRVFLRRCGADPCMVEKQLPRPLLGTHPLLDDAFLILCQRALLQALEKVVSPAAHAE